MKPLAHLFNGTLGYYLYDTNKNAIVKLNEKVYTYLAAYLEGDNSIEELPLEFQMEISKLKELGYLLEKRPQKIQHTECELIHSHLNGKLSNLILQVTQGCNLDCSYCVYSSERYEGHRKHSSKIMSIDTAKKAINFLLTNSYSESKVNIGFYGGEPLLRPNFIKDCIEYVKKVNETKEITYSITTNGTLINDKIMKLLYENDFRVLISLDGSEEIHDKYRRYRSDGRGTYADIMKNIENMLITFPDMKDRISFNIVLDPINPIKIKNEDFIIGRDKSEMSTRVSTVNTVYTNSRNVYSREFLEDFNHLMFTKYMYYLNRLKYSELSPFVKGMLVGEQKFIDNLNEINGLPDSLSHSGPCIPGRLRLFVNADGEFFPCERASEESEMLNIGNIERGYDFKKILDVLNICSITSEKCKNCWGILLCQMCAIQADDIDCFNKELKSERCEGILKDIDYSLKDYIGKIEIQSIGGINDEKGN